jgi:hypothetical protein
LAEKPACPSAEDAGDEEVELESGSLEGGDKSKEKGETGHELLA